MEGRLKTAALAHASKSLTLTIKREELVYHEGRHQVDHTAAYSVGPMPSWTPVPDVEDPRVIIPVGIAAAAGAWTRPAGGAWPHVAVCESTACTANSDGYVVSIQVTNVASTCPTSVACVYLSDRYIVVDPITEHRHIGNVPLYIEEPATAHGRTYRWTNIPARHLNPVKKRPHELYWYLPTALMHEFGHTIGLDDLVPTASYPNYLMGDLGDTSVTAIPPPDLHYLKQVYREYGRR